MRLNTAGRGAYGVTRWEGRQQPAHRVVFQLLRPDISIRGLDLHHTCHNLLCVNPTHLMPVDRAAHGRAHRTVQRPYLRGGKSHCGRGHVFTPANTYVLVSGLRRCRMCQRIIAARSRARRKALDFLERFG